MEYVLWIGFYIMTFYALLPALISRIFGFRVFQRGRADQEIALTFDDGPDPVYTPKLLDLLKKYGATGTFFLVGSHAEKYPEIVARIHDEGHVIGIHNYLHHSNWLMRPKTVKKQILRTSDVIKRITGIRPNYYRPPWGIVNLFDYRRLGHLQIVLWTGMFGDWKLRVGAEKLYRRMRRKLNPGEVFVLHDCGRTFGADEDAPGEMIKALERILVDGKQEGYRFVGVDEMISITEENNRRPKSEASSDQGGEETASRSATSSGRGSTRRIGPFKRAFVSLWMLWERAFHVLFRLRPIGDGSKYNYRIRKYGGPEIRLTDGSSLRRGDSVLELHFDNEMLFNMGMNARSAVHTAIQLIRDMEKGLPEIARTLENAPGGENVKALYGVSMIHRGAESMGFQVYDLPKGLFAWSSNLYLKFLLSVIHPEGGKRVREHGDTLSPRIILMERGDLLAWKDRSGRQRPSRISRREAAGHEPEEEAAPALSPDQVGV
ncbi:polysaccharide deacetylase family protein [Cohnella caldifontis]|uniref:polysaccharide deacetylase family protein n=1 Tax=Cohnella caldifontis TaxID=3027471 RepID=UPI0023EC51FD|nr:polysaccharide deacetylase family protein [Cohnella sp. YIM B05605]